MPSDAHEGSPQRAFLAGSAPSTRQEVHQGDDDNDDYGRNGNHPDCGDSQEDKAVLSVV
jgi:hypothetical protein